MKKDSDLPIRDQIAIECLHLDRMWEPATLEEIEGLYGQEGLKPWTQMGLAARRAYLMADEILSVREADSDPQKMRRA